MSGKSSKHRESFGGSGSPGDGHRIRERARMAFESGQPSVRVIMLPRDTNGNGSIFGGVLLSYIDQAGAVEAARHTANRLVTVAMDKVVFHQPVFVGDVVSFYTELVRVGRTSITVNVTVEACRRGAETPAIKVTEAQVVYVSIDDELKPVPVR